MVDEKSNTGIFYRNNNNNYSSSKSINNQSKAHKFSLRTQPKSQASTYYTINNAVRRSALNLATHEAKAFMETIVDA